jgi:hypothetical protein
VRAPLFKRTTTKSDCPGAIRNRRQKKPAVTKVTAGWF